MAENPWHLATLRQASMIAENVRSLIFDVPDFGIHKPGQHVDVRLTAPGGYMAERSYSLANVPEMDVVELGVQILENGEVSPYLWQIAPGATIELRGPLGGHFVWDTTMPGPLVLIAGGSGVVPMMSMLRKHVKDRNEGKTAEASRPVILGLSVRREALIPYRSELEELEREMKNIRILITVTDEADGKWAGRKGRFDLEAIRELVGPVAKLMPMVYICGPTPFVEAMAKTVTQLGINPHEVRTERFGG